MLQIKGQMLWLGASNLELRLLNLLNEALLDSTHPATTKDLAGCLFDIEQIRTLLSGLALPVSIGLTAARIHEELKEADMLISNRGHWPYRDRHRVFTIVNELKRNVAAELGTKLFFLVPSRRAKWYRPDDLPLFGNEVDATFPESTREISEAARCFAFGRWTACVFHLMRGAERALQSWGDDLPVDRERGQCGPNDFLKAADRRILDLTKAQRSAARDEWIKYWSETTGHVRQMMSAWRNHAAHGKETYDESQALSVLTHSEGLLRRLCVRPATASPV